MANERKRYTHSRNASSMSTYSGGSIRDHKRWSGVSIITGHPLSPRPRTPNLVDPLNSSSAAPDTIHKQLRLLRLDEIVSLAQDPRALRIVRQNDSLLRTVTTPIWSYYKFLWATASNVIMTTIQYDLCGWNPAPWARSLTNSNMLRKPQGTGCNMSSSPVQWCFSPFSRFCTSHDLLGGIRPLTSGTVGPF